MSKDKVQPAKKARKYLKAIADGETKESAKLIAGYSKNTNTGLIEKGVVFNQIASSMQEAILKQMPREEITRLLKRNASQDKELSASNGALKILADKVDPIDSGFNKIGDKVMIVINKPNATQ